MKISGVETMVIRLHRARAHAAAVAKAKPDEQVHGIARGFTDEGVVGR